VAAVVTDRTAGGSLQTGARYLGALLLIATGVVHLQQYFAVYYRVIPVIGPLFAANFAIGLLLGLLLLAPLGRAGRAGRALQLLAALGGIAFAAGTIIGLEISETGTLFGFHEHGYRAAIVISIAVEAAAIVTLAAFLLLAWRDRTASYGGRRAARDEHRLTS
jgi:hypothetical protein